MKFLSILEMYDMILVFQTIVVANLLNACDAYPPAANPPMLTHASMDVGNIISIVIPESPDENINIDQLTGEFRQQLERIKKQSRASKVEHGLVTLKRVLPEMSREEKRKTLPLIRRVLHGRKVSNPGSGRNWTREARVVSPREGGQYLHGRSAGSFEEKANHRSYEEIGNRELVTASTDLMSASRDDYHRIVDRTYPHRRTEQFAMQEDFIHRDDHVRQEESIRRDDVERLPEPDVQTKLTNFVQEWNNPVWDDQTRGNDRPSSETSTIDCDNRHYHSIRQIDPANENFRDQLNRTMDEMSTDYTKLNQRISPRYSERRQYVIDNGKRNVKDFPGLEPADVPTYINYRRESVINEAIDPNCDESKRNHSSESAKEPRTFTDVLSNKVHPRGPTTFDIEEYRSSRKAIQDSRKQFERSKVPSLENVANEGFDNYTEKKKKGQIYAQGQDSREFPSIPPGVGWNAAIYPSQLVNSSEETNPSNVYEMFGEKTINPGLSYVQTEQGGLRPQASLNYGDSGLALRMQRAIAHARGKLETPTFSNITGKSDAVSKLNEPRRIFQRLKHLFRAPVSPMISYKRVILVYGNDKDSRDNGNPEAFTEAEISQLTSSASMAEPPSSTSRDLPRSESPVADSHSHIRPN